MHRRDFTSGMLAGFTAMSFDSADPAAAQGGPQNPQTMNTPYLEKAQPGQPHKGKVLAAIQPHSETSPCFSPGHLVICNQWVGQGSIPYANPRRSVHAD